MPGAVGPTGGNSNGFVVNPKTGQQEMPPGPPLPADDPWVKNLALLFPNASLDEIRMYAAKFRDNMFQALNNEIQRDLKRARAAAQKFKESIDDDN